MPKNPEYEKKLKDMSEQELFEEMDSAALVVNGFSENNKAAGMAAKAQIRHNMVAAEILKRELWAKYNKMEDMTKEEFAKLLHGRQYRDEMTKEEEAMACRLGLFVFFGASDDLLEVRGVENDEYGAWNGTRVFINPDTSITDRPRDPRSVQVTAIWSPEEPRASWLIKSTIGGVSFDIFEDDELYCRGLIIDKADLNWDS